MRRSIPWLVVMTAVLLLTACSRPLGLIIRPTPTPNRQADPAAIAAKEAAHPDPTFDFGYTVQITSAGAHPAWLVADCCGALIWKNLTSKPITVILDHLVISSGPIPPGGKWVYKPRNIQSITYHVEGEPDLHGAIQVNQTFESLRLPSRNQMSHQSLSSVHEAVTSPPYDRLVADSWIPRVPGSS